MFLKSLLISTPTKVIREIPFHKGLNLIVDETPSCETLTGNNVGKTTVLRLLISALDVMVAWCSKTRKVSERSTS
jgi:uncharacterized protein YydD (DUF2326 family)